MALFTISDLHLPLGIDKPMDIFGGGWENYVEKIREEWLKNVGPEDTVVLPGDFSWATYLEESRKDFEFLNVLPGKKILLKGNHDYWWTTMKKLREFIEKEGFFDVEFLHNNSFIYNDVAICGTRGWSYIGVGDAKDEDIKIYERELGRLELSIAEAKKHSPQEIICFMHYPPILPGIFENGFTEIFKKYGIKRCIYGHIHGPGRKYAVTGDVGGVHYMLVSCDCLGFSPVKLCE